MLLRRVLPLVVTIALVLVTADSAGAQSRRASAPAPASMPTLVGLWSGTATVQLGDSTLVVPVNYTFTQAGANLAGTAMVPGQGAGPIGNVVREGKRLRFRVTAPEGKRLEHDGAFVSDDAIEGIVTLDSLPVAKFRIAAKRGAPAAK
ncbi:MAG: hypothetical protein IPF47_15610 [Gemmatimonadetes bacterium]|nr:hypothetical protein [Gemmatimonadota bacterium]